MTHLRKAIVVDANAIFREGLVKILPEALNLDCRGFESLERMKSTNFSDLENALFLVDCGQSEAGITFGIGCLREEFPQAYVVVLSECYSHTHMLCAFRAGARGYIVKQTNSEAIIRSLQLVCLGEHVFPVRFVEWLSLSGPHSGPNGDLDKREGEEIFDILSPREVEVFAVLCEGKSNKAIARRCGITEATVKVHVKAILRKLKARNRTEAAVWARDHMFPANGYPLGI